MKGCQPAPKRRTVGQIGGGKRPQSDAERAGQPPADIVQVPSRPQAGAEPVQDVERTKHISQPSRWRPSRRGLWLPRWCRAGKVRRVKTPALNLVDFDPATPVVDDLFRHANGHWLATAPIPEDRPRWGAFDRLVEESEQAVHEIIDGLPVGGNPAGNDVADEPAKIAALYNCFMDEARADALGAAPLQPIFERIDAISDTADLARYWGWAARHGVGGVFDISRDADPGDPARYVIFFGQSGLGLPDEEYYRLDQHAGIRTAYLAHIEKTLALAGLPDAAAQAQAVFDLETAIAACHWDKVRLRDLVEMYHLQNWADFAAETPQLHLDELREAAHLAPAAVAEVVNAQRSFPADLARLVTDDALPAWRSWARWQAAHALSPYLGADLVDERFDFYGRILQGVPVNRERWKRGVALAEGVMGEAIGKLYVADHFPPEAKAAADELVANLLEAYRRSIKELDWMGETTKAEALKKLFGFRPKIGYPSRWRDYSQLQVSDDLVANVMRAATFEFDYLMGQAGGPVDKEEWEMFPQTVNAYYHPLRNEIVFPAAILQPPFFNPAADDAVNYGGIGAVIGHEIGHGFDDQGSATDAEGKLRNWWTDADRAAFEQRTAGLVAQYNALSPAAAPEVHINGELTLGENIGDLGGLSIAYLAWTIARAAAGDLSDEPVDDYTPAQRFFLSWAAVWQGKARPEMARQLAVIDPHSPAEHRCDQVAKNVPAFHEAFGVKPGDGMWLPPEQRVKIW